MEIIVYIFIMFTIPSILFIVWKKIDDWFRKRRIDRLVKMLVWHMSMGLNETMLIKVLRLSK